MMDQRVMLSCEAFAENHDRDDAEPLNTLFDLNAEEGTWKKLHAIQ